MFDITLDKKTAYEIYVIAEVCSKSETTDDFLRNVIPKIQQVVGQEMTICSLLEINSAKIVSILNVGAPADFIETIIDVNNCFKSPLYHRWSRVQTPQLFKLGDRENNLSVDETMLYENFEISNVLAHGMVDLDQRHATYFSFSKIQQVIDPSYLYFMSFMIPHLHVAYVKINRSRLISDTSVHSCESISMFFDQDKSNETGVLENNNKQNLSSRELEVLVWLLNGKSNWDIGKILNISEFTVKNHVQSILKKLNANSRQHAVAKGLEAGLIKI